MKATLELPRLLLDFGAIMSLPDELDRLSIRTPLLMTDAGITACGILERVLGAAPAIDHVCDRIRENPVFADCDAAAAIYRDHDCDGIVALGGGSVLDAAKMTAVLAGQGGCAADFAGRSELISQAAAPIVAIPTTAGTGSEVSQSAGLHPDPVSRAVGIRSPFLMPRLTLCDPELTLTLPPGLTAATGIDALTHCVEGYLSTTPSPLADALALDGVRRAVAYLEAATLDGSDRTARWHMMAAAFAGGAAIGKGLGPAHAIAISCGDQGIHHGRLSAIGLLASLELLQEHCAPKLADIAVAMSLPTGETVRDWLSSFMHRLGLPTTLAQAGYRIGDLDILASACAASFFNATSPFKPGVAEYARVLTAVAD